MIRYRDDDNDDGGGREGALLSLMPLSSRKDPSALKVFDNGSSLAVAQFLAWKHVEERSRAVIPSLSKRLATCDFHWTFEGRDTQWQQQVAVEEFVDAIAPNMTTAASEDYSALNFLRPFAVAGTTTSRITEPVSIIGSAFDTPLISGGSTSPALEEQPFFGAVIPSNSGDARAIVLYLQSLGVKHMASLFQQDAWGRNYNSVLQGEASQNGMLLESFSYDPKVKDDQVAYSNSIQESIEQLAASGMRYIFFIGYDYATVLPIAHDYGIVGNNQYSWYAAGGRKWTKQSFELSKDDETEQKIAQALDGIGTVSLHVDTNPSLEQAMRDFVNDKQLQQEFISMHPEGSRIYENYTFHERELSVYHHMFYDAVYALGIAACETPGLFTGTDLFETMSSLQFEGVTGNVRFDSKTGVRDPDSVQYRIDNVFWSHGRSDTNFTRFAVQIGAIVTQGEVRNNTSSWLYNGNTTTPPLDLEPGYHDYNLMSTGVQAIGWSLSALMMLLSMALIACVLSFRKRYVIKASQPIFLCQLCVGTMIMAAALIPMGMQGLTGDSKLDAACMSSAWLLCCGFVVAFSALLSKTLRLNQLVKAGLQMKRVSVKPTQVVWTTVLLLIINVALLLGWTLVSPLRYVRVEDNNDIDKYGRSEQSAGQCQCFDNKYLYFVLPIFTINFVGVAVAAYQTYKARHFPTALSESKYLALSMASLLETMVLGGPVLFATRNINNDPTAFYMVASALIVVTICSFLIPVFVPKYCLRNAIPVNPIRAVMSSRISSTMQSRVSGGASSLVNDRFSFVSVGSGMSSMKSTASARRSRRGEMQISRVGSFVASSGV